MKYGNMVSQRSYQRVLLAVYWTAEPQGLLCASTNVEIAAAAGVGVETVRKYIHAMEADWTIATFEPGGERHRRLVVIMDHPLAEKVISTARDTGRRFGHHTAIARKDVDEVEADWTAF